MAAHSVRVRGIYATALTKLLQDQGVPIADPSPIVAERANLPRDTQHAGVSIASREDRQGVLVSGEAAGVPAVLELLQARLPRAVARRDGRDNRWTLEFPSSVKRELDGIRRELIPTIRRHHQLKVVSSSAVDLAEERLAQAPGTLDEISEQAWAALLLGDSMRRGTPFVVQHVKPAGQAYPLKGTIGSLHGRHLRLERRFHPGGLYDSLEVPRMRGDYGYLDIELDSGIAVRRYYRANGEHLGDLYNLATEAELYPGFVRYVDLELDVLHMPGEPPRVEDEAELERAHQDGYLSDTLVEDAWRMAREVIARIDGMEPQLPVHS